MLTPPSSALWLLVALAAGFFLLPKLCRPRRRLSATHLRGRQLASGPQNREPTNGILLGQHPLPHRAAYGHFAFVGATGSGKTLLQRLLTQSCLPRIGRGHGHRALIYDAKQDTLATLAGMALPCPIHTFNPLDARGVAWDMAADITSPAAALQVATLLIPTAQHDSNPFFTNAARHLLHGVLLTFIQSAPKRWTFRHLLLTLRNPHHLQATLAQTPTTHHLLQYFEHGGTFANILSTLLTYTAPFEIIAAAWDRAPESISLRHWLNNEAILVLGNDEANRTAIDTLNRLIFQRLTELILAGPEIDTSSPTARKTWIFLDEVRQAGRLNGLGALMTKGRSKGACVVLGFQDINGLREVYGREAADELVGQCTTKAILRLNSPETARWASGLFGSHELMETRRTHSRSHNFRSLGLDLGSSSSGQSTSNGIVKRELVLDSELMGLPETNRHNGLHAYFLSPITGAFLDHIPGEWLARQLIPSTRTTPNFVPRPESDQYLRPWSADDDRILGNQTAPKPQPDASPPVRRCR